MEKAPPTKRPRYDAAFRAEALRLASESRSTLAALCLAEGGPTALAGRGRRGAGAARGQ